MTTTNIKYHPAGQFEYTRFEKIHNIVFSNSNIGSICVAKEIAELIIEKQKKISCVFLVLQPDLLQLEFMRSWYACIKKKV